jgi:hypothetical protein
MGTLNLDKLTPSENTLLNSIAIEVRGDYHILIDKLARGNEDNIHWVISSLASRNKYISPLFIRCCKLLLVKKMVSENNTNKIILSDYSLYKVIKKHYKSKNSDITIDCTQKATQKLKRKIVPVMKYAGLLKLLMFRYYGKSNKKTVKLNPDKPITLIDTFVLNSKVGEQGSIVNGKYQDRYYPGLLSSLSNKEKNNIYYLPETKGFSNYKTIFNDIRSSQDNFIIRDDYLIGIDYLKILLHPVKKLFLNLPKITYREIDIDALVKDENWQNFTNAQSIKALINYYFAYRFSKEDIQVNLLIEWYENQVNDRGAIVGFHRFMPKTKIIGYQGFIISQLLHHYVNPSRSEMRSGAVPDEVAVIGKGLIDDAKQFCKEVKVSVAPAFRNQNVWEKATLIRNPEFLYVLVALPIDLNEAKKILYIISQLNLQDNVKVWVKPHPTYGPNEIKEFVSNNNKKIQIITGYFNDYLEKASLIISNASVTPVEAIAKGVPAIILTDFNSIVQNPIPQKCPSQIWKLCYTVEETQYAMDKFLEELKNNPTKYLEISKNIRDNYFEPVTKESIRAFLKLDIK